MLIFSLYQFTSKMGGSIKLGGWAGMVTLLITLSTFLAAHSLSEYGCQDFGRRCPSGLSAVNGDTAAPPTTTVTPAASGNDHIRRVPDLRHHHHLGHLRRRHHHRHRHHIVVTATADPIFTTATSCTWGRRSERHYHWGDLWRDAPAQEQQDVPREAVLHLRRLHLRSHCLPYLRYHRRHWDP